MAKLKRNYKTEKGFTLIELLVVIAIIGILTGIILSVLGSARAQARDVTRKAEVPGLRYALELYYLDNNQYPEITNWIKIEQDADTNGPFSQALSPYAPTLPRDRLYPKEEDGKKFSYQYKSTTGGTDCLIHAELEGGGSYEVSCLAGSVGIAYGGGDQVQNCINNSSAHIGWILAADIRYVDKAVVSGLANDCSGLLLTVIVSGDLICDTGPCYGPACYLPGNPTHCYNDGCGIGSDPEVGRASSTIPNNGDNNNATTVDFVPDAWIPPVECVDVDVS